MNFSDQLQVWYLHNKRNLPWRNTANPYKIWLSEIMLQQTRVAQALPYFNTFIEKFPTVFDMAQADEEQVLIHWQGLGYYSRARNMHKTAQIIAFELNGNFPDNYTNLLKLKGIGSYTAAAIASFAFNEVVPVVDGNVYRVLARYFAIETDISSSVAKKEFTLLAQQLIDKNNPALFNQAIMEFGALQCVPKNPDCQSCVFNNSCVALQKKKVGVLPVNLKKTKVTNRFFSYLILIDKKNNTTINKRTEKGIWHNLYEFPVIETTKEIAFDELINEIPSKFPEMKIENIKPYHTNPIIHKLSHQKLLIHFYKIEVSSDFDNKIAINTLKNYPFPVVIYNFIEKYL